MFLLNTNYVFTCFKTDIKKGRTCFKEIIDRTLFPLFIGTILVVKIPALIQYPAHSVYPGNSCYQLYFLLETGNWLFTKYYNNLILSV